MLDDVKEKLIPDNFIEINIGWEKWINIIIDIWILFF